MKQRHIFMVCFKNHGQEHKEVRSEMLRKCFYFLISTFPSRLFTCQTSSFVIYQKITSNNTKTNSSTALNGTTIKYASSFNYNIILPFSAQSNTNTYTHAHTDRHIVHFKYDQNISIGKKKKITEKIVEIMSHAPSSRRKYTRTYRRIYLKARDILSPQIPPTTTVIRHTRVQYHYNKINSIIILKAITGVSLCVCRCVRK